MKGYTLVKNPITVNIVIRNSPNHSTQSYMKEFTQEKNPMYVRIAKQNLDK